MMVLERMVLPRPCPPSRASALTKGHSGKESSSTPRTGRQDAAPIAEKALAGDAAALPGFKARVQLQARWEVDVPPKPRSAV